MRHAKAEPNSASGKDYDRALTDSGIEMAMATAKCMHDAGRQIDGIVTSSAKRTLQTAGIVAKIVCPDAPFLALDELYLAEPESYVHAIYNEVDPESTSVLVVGHNPGMSQLMCFWANKMLSVPPSTVAVFDIETDDWTSVRSDIRPVGKLNMLIHKGSVIP